MVTSLVWRKARRCCSLGLGSAAVVLLMTERSNLLLSVLEKMMKAAMLRRQTGAVVTSSASLLEEEAIAQSLRFLASPFEPKPPRPPVRRQQQQPLRPVAAERPPCPSRGCSTSASLRPSSLPLRQLGALLLPPSPTSTVHSASPPLPPCAKLPSPPHRGSDPTRQRSSRACRRTCAGWTRAACAPRGSR